MGQIAEDMINGACCALCGQYFVPKNSKKEITLFIHGYPVACNDCYDKDCGYQKQNKDAQIL